MPDLYDVYIILIPADNDSYEAATENVDSVGTGRQDMSYEAALDFLADLEIHARSLPSYEGE